jgi:glycosyltransferase involved in cell wall biosynthesis
LLVPANNAAAIANAIERLIADPTERKQIGAAGLHSFQRQFSWDAVRKTYDQLLAEEA